MANKEVRKLAAVMFTDIQGYTAFVQQDEAAALIKVATHRKYLEQFTAAYNGKVIAFYGDGSLSIYESALDAVNCGIAMQKAYQGDLPIPVRIGIHVGDIVIKDETIYGDGVNISSRIQASGIPGSVYISDRVQAELTNHPEIKTRSIGKKRLKNVTQPIEVFVVTNDGLMTPSLMTKMPDLKKFYRYIPLLLIAGLAWWYIGPNRNDQFSSGVFNKESISVPLFTNNTGDPTLDHISEMAAHWITKELSTSSDAHVVSYESASEMVQLAGLSLDTPRGRKKFKTLSGAVNILDGSFMLYGDQYDSMMMIGYIRDLETGDVIEPIKDVRCKSANPMDCIQEMASKVKGYWVSRGNVISPPKYEAYKAYFAAKKAWATEDTNFVFNQLNKAISLDADFFDPYLLMLTYFSNYGSFQRAADTLQVVRKKFPELEPREYNLLQYHIADVEGKNADTYRYFLNEYEHDRNDLFTNNNAIVLALMYRHSPREALRFYNDFPNDSLNIEGCTYCAVRFECAMWAALDLDSMALADQLAPKIKNALLTSFSYSTLLMYYVWKNDTTKIDELILAAKLHPKFDRDWQFLPVLASRFFLIRGDSLHAALYAQKAIEACMPLKGRLLGKSYYLHGQLDKALLVYKEEIKKHPGNKDLHAELGMIYARQGNNAAALKTNDQLKSMQKPFDYGVVEYLQGRIYAVLGDFEKATSLLQESLSKGMKFRLETFNHDPDLMGLTTFPAYVQLMEQFN
jgi:class 3 adenylate cyclase